ncbi:MAG: hypothetical protein R2838_07240 [Caldilineaceae bacterium]
MAPLAEANDLGRQMACPWPNWASIWGAWAAQMQRMGGDYATFLAALADPGFETNLTLTESYKPAPDALLIRRGTRPCATPTRSGIGRRRCATA